MQNRNKHRAKRQAPTYIPTIYQNQQNCSIINYKPNQIYNLPKQKVRNIWRVCCLPIIIIIMYLLQLGLLVSLAIQPDQYFFAQVVIAIGLIILYLGNCFCGYIFFNCMFHINKLPTDFQTNKSKKGDFLFLILSNTMICKNFYVAQKFQPINYDISGEILFQPTSISQIEYNYQYQFVDQASQDNFMTYFNLFSRRRRLKQTSKHFYMELDHNQNFYFKTEKSELNHKILICIATLFCLSPVFIFYIHLVSKNYEITIRKNLLVH